MLTIRIIYLALCGLLSVNGLLGQSLERLVQDADYTLYQEYFVNAFQHYEKIRSLYPEETDYLYHREIAYHMTIGRGSPLDNLLSYEKTKGAHDKFYNYWLGRIHFNRYEFEDAKKHLEAFLQLEAYKSAAIVEETHIYLEQIDKAIPFYNDPDYYEIQLMGGDINTEYAEISPAFFSQNSELLYASSRPTKPGRLGKEEFRIFHTVRLAENLWSPSTPLDVLGTFDITTAKVEVVDENGKLYIYRDNGGGDLFYSQPEGDGWSKPEELDSRVKKSMLESHFFINDAENHIFFASETEENGLDIFESFFDTSQGEWTDPAPLKGNVNTPDDEDSPFLSHDGNYLYFSSTREESIGGYDVFLAQLERNSLEWTSIENLGFPINTIDDEINFQLNTDGQTGYFSSNRLHGKGDFDVYYFHEIQKLTTQGIVLNDITGVPVRSATVKFHPIVYEDESFTAITDSAGRYSVSLIAKEKFHTEVFIDDQIAFDGTFESFTNDPFSPIRHDFGVVPPATIKNTDYVALFEGEEGDETTTIEMIANKFTIGQKVVINNIYFKFESDEIIVDNDHIIDQIYAIMKVRPDLIVEIAGHTDNLGDADFNLDLSLRRAQKIADKLVDKGIDPGRIIPRGYGETQPLASNDDEVGGRELNRRIEIKALDANNPDRISNSN